MDPERAVDNAENAHEHNDSNSNHDVAFNPAPSKMFQTTSRDAYTLGAEHSSSSPANAITEAVAEEARGVPASRVTHGLVRFGRLYGFYYIPAKVRDSVAVGELVLVEAGRGEGTGTLVADVTPFVQELRMSALTGSLSSSGYLTSAVGKEGDFAARQRLLDDILCPEELDLSTLTAPARLEAKGGFASEPPRRHRFDLYACPPVSGLPQHDDNLQRLPCVLCRGANKDKKKLYYSRKRDAEALQLVSKFMFDNNWYNHLSLYDVSYQVDFLSITLFARGGNEFYGSAKSWADSIGTAAATAATTTTTTTTAAAGATARKQWGPAEYAAVGAALAAPLRTDVVEFRFSLQHPHLAHLTRRIVGNSHNTVFEDVIHRYDRQHSAQQRSSSNSNSNSAISPNASAHRPSSPTQQQQHQTTQSGVTVTSRRMSTPTLNASAAPLQSTAPPQTQSQTFIQTSPQQQQQQPTPQFVFTTTSTSVFPSQQEQQQQQQQRVVPPLQSFVPAMMPPISPLSPPVAGAALNPNESSLSALSFSHSYPMPSDNHLWVSTAPASQPSHFPQQQQQSHRHQPLQFHLTGLPTVSQPPHAPPPLFHFATPSAPAPTAATYSKEAQPLPVYAQQQQQQQQQQMYHYLPGQNEGSYSISGTSSSGPLSQFQQQHQQQLMYMVAGTPPAGPASNSNNNSSSGGGAPAMTGSFPVQTVHVFPNYGKNASNRTQ